MADTEQPEAGPSRPRSRPASPRLDPVPAIPLDESTTAPASPVVATPQQTPEPRTARRSWFGFGSSPAATSTPIKAETSPSPSHTPVGQQSISRSSSGLPDLDFPLPPGSTDADILDAPPSQSTDVSARRETSLEARAGGTPDADQLDINGQAVLPDVRSSKRHSKEQEGEGQDVMQMQDLSSSRPLRTSSHAAEATPDNSPPPPPPAWDEKPTPPRIPSASYTTRRLPSAPGPLSFPSPTKYRPLARPTLPVRSSSRRVSSGSSIAQTEKDRPPLPVDRPLPPVPPDPAAQAEDDRQKPNLQIDAGSFGPAVPREIVITPSSPLRSDHPHETISHQLALAASEGLTDPPPTKEDAQESGLGDELGQPGDGSPVKRRAPIGLGLPPQLVQQPAEDVSAPSVPVRIQPQPQAVSSPLPSSSPRSASPRPKLLFSEPQTPKQMGKQASPDDVATDKPPRMRRVRSASGLLGKKTPTSSRASSRASSRERPPPVPPLPTDQPECGPSTARPAPPRKQDKEKEKSKTGGGVLEWLGVRKTVKKRKSDAQLSQPVPPTGGDITPTRASVSSERMEQARHSAEIASRRASEAAVPGSTKQRDRSRSRASTKEQARSLPKSGGFFSRKASNRTIDLDDNLNPIQIPGTSGSRRSSPSPYNSTEHLVIPSPSAPDHAFDSLASPITLDSHMARAWSSSRTSETEELLNSPGTSAHWGPGVRPWMDGSGGSNRRSPRTAASSPLGSLPEQSLLGAAMEAAQEAERKEPAKSVLMDKRDNRPRSHSDAPRPASNQPPAPSPISATFTPPAGPSSPAPHHLTLPAGASRPKLGARSNSGNSAVIGRMRAAFSTKSMSRERSRTLQPTTGSSSGAVDEFGGRRPSGPAPASADMLKDDSQRSLLGLNSADRQIFLNHTPGTSPRGSIAASFNSTGPASAVIPSSPDPAGRMSRLRTRMRASTVSSGQSSSSLVPPTSPTLFPLAATPPRRRPSVIQRLSNSRFGTVGSPKSGSSLFPLPPRSSGSVSSSTGPDQFWGETPPALLSPSTSPRPSMGSISAAMGERAQKAVAKQLEGETVDAWLERVTSQVGRSEITNVLAASGDEFHSAALRKYMTRFDFSRQPLDVALRSLLMHVSLPRETQQIDRIIEAFAQRYEDCEPGLFLSKDNTYILAFSMMMLHTDAFNRHNKNKMTKADYVRNTRMQGVPPSVLEIFFENITYTPFIFVEDDQALQDPASSDLASSTASFGGSGTSSSAPSIGKAGKIDVNRLIRQNALDSLRSLEPNRIAVDNPISCLGTRVVMDLEGLHRAFTAEAFNIAFPTNRPRATSAILQTPGRSAAKAPEITLRAAKIGLLSRQDEAKDAARKQKKWKDWTAIITSSQIVLLKDPTLATALTANQDSTIKLLSKPDEMIPVLDAVAYHDRSSDIPFSFFLAGQLGVRMCFRAANELEMNEWIHLVNYASAFRSPGIRLRAAGLAKDEAVLAGAAAAASHKRDVQIRKSHEEDSQPKHSFGSSNRDGLEEAAESHGRELSGKSEPEAEAVQLDKVFTTVKAELAAGRGGAERIERPSQDEQQSKTLGDLKRVTSSRGDHVKAHLASLEEKRKTVQHALDESLRLARNLGILTPFQRPSRDRVVSSLPSLASRVKQERIQLARLEVWIDILRRDQAAELRDFARIRHVALQAAAKSLRDPGGVQGVVEDAHGGERAIPIPTFSLSSNDEPPADDVRVQPDGGEHGGASSAPLASTQSGAEYFAASPDNLTPAGESGDPFSSSVPLSRRMSRASALSWHSESSRAASPALGPQTEPNGDGDLIETLVSPTADDSREETSQRPLFTDLGRAREADDGSIDSHVEQEAANTPSRAREEEREEETADEGDDKYHQ